MAVSLLYHLGAPLLFGAPVRAEDDLWSQIPQRAQRAYSQGAYSLSLELYLGSMRLFDRWDPAQRNSILNGLVQTCGQLLKGQRVEPAVRGLLALAAAELAGQGQPWHPWVQKSLEESASLAMTQKQPELAVAALEGLGQISALSSDQWSLLVKAYLQSQQLEQAEKSITTALQRHPGAISLQRLYAVLSHVQVLSAASQLDYPKAESVLSLTITRLQQQAKDNAKASGPHQVLGQMLTSQAFYYQATGQSQGLIRAWGQAEEALVNAVYLDPTDPQPAWELGALNYGMQDWSSAAHWFSLAQQRYQRGLNLSSTAQGAMAEMRDREARAKRNVLASLSNWALDEANLGRFDRAHNLMEKVLASAPEFRAQAEDLLRWIGESQKRLSASQREGDLGGDQQVRQGDQWMRLHQFDRADGAYGLALTKPLKLFSRAEVEARRFGAAVKPEQVRAFQFEIGNQKVELELPEEIEISTLKAPLYKAHAITQGIFPSQLHGPLAIRVFGNHRAFLEQVGPRINADQTGGYSFGRVTTFHDPMRRQSEWVDLLTFQISRRYIDELSYLRAPSWLSMGIAAWVSRKPEKPRSGPPELTFAWNDLDFLFTKYWNEPDMQQQLLLQTGHMVSWMVQRFGLPRLMAVLHLLRDQRSLEQAFQVAFGADLPKLEQKWLGELLAQGSAGPHVDRRVDPDPGLPGK